MAAIWQPVLTATADVVEAAYLSGSTWTAYPPVTVTGNSNSDYTFAFVGDQKGRWRVTAFNGTAYSSPSARWTFSYNTTPQMATPIQTNPANNEIFGHYSAGPHAVLEDGACGGGLQPGDSVLRFNQDDMRELSHCHDQRSTTVRLHL
jgi:hypothetical protein